VELVVALVALFTYRRFRFHPGLIQLPLDLAGLVRAELLLPTGVIPWLVATEEH
jgi:hypothetical protein